ncbi:glycosyl transferase family protein [Vibrio nitrifigilis]|uniref:Glycosyl transferase family protein n=1 Tax=Vibrio nitrifigilis TaxID=2789781 RepID=A0ABS0GEM1_9VIBR|nr:glycosyl transferase family protein [Vibrio nitrifigilis]MBF9000815.1 glycosyl transferase family protein [Vibrio nitrifigilis]
MSHIVECIRTVGRGERSRQSLTFEQAYQVMDDYLNGQVDDDQMGVLLMLIRVKNESKQEIAGFVKAFQQRIPAIGCDIDWPVYAGKRAATGLPWYLIAATLLAKQGKKVLLHGYDDPAVEREYAEPYLAALSIPVAESAEDAKQLFLQGNIVYLPLHAFAPKALHMLNWKHKFGLKSPINTVVRTLNPGGGTYGIRGSFHPGFARLHAEVENEVGQNSHTVISIKGQSGEAEYNPKVSQTLYVSTPQGVEEHYWQERYSEQLSTPIQCQLGTPTDQHIAMANSVVSTVAALLFTEYQDRDKAYDEALEMWQHYVDLINQ